MMIRNRLKHWRHMHEMNQKEFAKFLEVTQEQISRWESQHYQPNVETSFKMCNKLKITMEELFEIDP